ncbi:MAG TPA: MBL fold metallo-hydrolase [Sphingorhabdus sp.]|nr:MBL fold metallo-hydrolase [Sphingorhabdus sp.]
MPKLRSRQQHGLLSIALAMLTLPTFPIAAAPAPVESPGVVAQPAGVHRIRVGDALVTALSDGTLPIDLRAVLHGIDAEQIEPMLAEAFQRNPVETSINVFLIELGDRHILVDTGAGELFGPGVGGRLPRALAAAGVRPEQITDILITHVHSDHSGGLTVGGRMVYPNATVHVGRPDIDFFLTTAKDSSDSEERRLAEEAKRTLGPYVAAGRVKPFDGAAEVVPGITAELRPGHTPGAAFYTLTSAGQSIVFIGDTVHAAAVQLVEPAVTIVFDQNQPRARAIRQQALARFAAEGTLLAAPHISFPGVGRVKRDGTGYRWIPVDYTDRHDPTPSDNSGGRSPR